MTDGLAFLKKEFLAIARTYRIWVVPLIFAVFGLMSPPIAKLTPEIAKSALVQTGITIKIPEPTILDAFSQYLKNLSQLGLLAIILLSMGLVSEEKVRGTLRLVVTKPVSRAAVVLSKFLAQEVLVIASLIVGGILCYLYAILIFPDGKLLAFLQANALYVLYYSLIIAVTLFFSTIVGGLVAAGGLAILAFTVLSILPTLHESLSKYSPAALTSVAANILTGQGEFSQALWPAIVSLVLIAVSLALGIFIFQRQEL